MLGVTEQNVPLIQQSENNVSAPRPSNMPAVAVVVGCTSCPKISMNGVVVVVEVVNVVVVIVVVVVTVVVVIVVVLVVVELAVVVVVVTVVDVFVLVDDVPVLVDEVMVAVDVEVVLERVLVVVRVYVVVVCVIVLVVVAVKVVVAVAVDVVPGCANHGATAGAASASAPCRSGVPLGTGAAALVVLGSGPERLPRATGIDRPILRNAFSERGSSAWPNF